ncbi:hypothetical protein [Patulibacter defluvii]|uniref:hypothetical protein n=1 Tax=Patulibacter defluvii TaxID=3095358 RepID=UPI002A748368|nr:hypothetical protein [Patulibacter sp. DM4]
MRPASLVPPLVLLAVTFALVAAGGDRGAAGAGGDGADRSWALADASVAALDDRWRGSGYGRDAKLDEQLLIVHAEAAAADHHGATRRDERVRALADRLVRRRWVPTLDPGRARRGGAGRRTDFACAPGWSSSDAAVRMHPSSTGLISAALAAAWRVRERVGLPTATRERIRRRLLAVARGGCWRFPAAGQRGINQVNWSADVVAAAADVVRDPRPLWADYRRQLLRFVADARRARTAGGSPNFSSGFGFRYEARDPPTTAVNATDTVEYSNIVFSALAHHDRAIADGMRPLPPAAVAVLRGWAAHLYHGTWAPSGYLNWDSGKGRARLHLTQYWLYAASSLVAGLEGSRSLRLLPDPAAAAAAIRGRVVRLAQRRATVQGTLRLAATGFGLRSGFGGPGDRKPIVGARLADLLVRFRALDRVRPAALGGFADDRGLGRIAVATDRYSTAIVRPRDDGQGGGLEPARILDGAATAVTGIGGRGAGTLGLVVADGGRPLIDTQGPLAGQWRSPARVPAALADRSGTLPAGLTVSGTAQAPGVAVGVVHRFRGDRIVTRYRIANERGRALLVLLRIPSYAGPAGERPRLRERPPAAPVRRAGRVVLPVRGLDGARFRVVVDGVPGTPSVAVRRVPADRFNPRPGPQLVVGLRLPPGETTLRRTVVVDAPPQLADQKP